MSENFVNAVIWLVFIFLCTMLGAAFTYIFPRRVMEKVNILLSGFAVGVMLAASVWSLIIPSIEGSAFTGAARVTETLIGLALGGIFMIALAKFIPDENDGSVQSFSRLFIAVTMHNIPEGLAVGFAFGAVASRSITLASAIAVAFGIGIQNVPEGAAVSFAARGISGKNKSFLFGMFSGAVEPIAGIIGFIFSGFIASLLPYTMSFAAGAMIFASITELLPDALKSSKIKTVVGVLLGFMLMMSLDVIFG